MSTERDQVTIKQKCLYSNQRPETGEGRGCEEEEEEVVEEEEEEEEVEGEKEEKKEEEGEEEEEKEEEKTNMWKDVAVLLS